MINRMIPFSDAQKELDMCAILANEASNMLQA